MGVAPRVRWGVLPRVKAHLQNLQKRAEFWYVFYVQPRVAPWVVARVRRRRVTLGATRGSVLECMDPTLVSTLGSTPGRTQGSTLGSTLVYTRGGSGSAEKEQYLVSTLGSTRGATQGFRNVRFHPGFHPGCNPG